MGTVGWQVIKRQTIHDRWELASMAPYATAGEAEVNARRAQMARPQWQFGVARLELAFVGGPSRQQVLMA